MEDLVTKHKKVGIIYIIFDKQDRLDYILGNNRVCQPNGSILNYITCVKKLSKGIVSITSPKPFTEMMTNFLNKHRFACTTALT